MIDCRVALVCNGPNYTNHILSRRSLLENMSRQNCNSQFWDLVTFRSMIQITQSTIFLLGNKASLKLVDRC